MQPSQYFIHAEPQRVQEVQHFFSSMEAPVLGNIEMKLEAQRLRNHEIGAAYFQQKYGSSHQYQDILRRTGVEAPVRQQRVVFNMEPHSVSGNQDYEEFLKNVLKDKQREIEEAVRNQKPIAKARENPWVETQEMRTPIKPQEVKYVSEFQKYRQNKTKKEEPLKTKQEKKPKKNYKRELIIKIFRQLDTQQTGFVEKYKLIEYLKSNIKIVQVFDLIESQLASNMYSYETENSEEMKINELLEHFGEDGNIERLRESIHYSKINNKLCLFGVEQFRLLEEIFKSLDPHNDLIVKRETFVKALLVNPEVGSFLYQPAVREKRIQRDINLYRILERIEHEHEFSQGQDKKVKEYISFGQFLKYFETEYRWDEEGRNLNRLDLNRVVDSVNRRHPQNHINVDRGILEVLMIALKKTDKEGPFLLVRDLRRNLETVHEYKTLAETEVRNANLKLGIPAETLGMVIKRASEDSFEYLSFVEMIEMFGARGVPADYIPKQPTPVQPTPQDTVPEAEKPREQRKIDGYDSDPEMYRSNLQVDQFRGTFVSIVEDSNAFSTMKHKLHSKSTNKMREHHHHNHSAEDPQDHHDFREYNQDPQDIFRITVPEPFSFENRELLSKNKKFQEDDVGLGEEAAHSFKAKGIPRDVLEIGKFARINEENERRRENIKKMSILASLAQEKPFGFLTRETKPRRKNMEERKQFVFKSKPVPNSCKPGYMKERNEEEGRLRKDRIERMALDSLAKSKLPSRMDRHLQEEKLKAEERLKGEERPQSIQREPAFKAKTPPDFSRIHKGFSEKMERNRQSKKGTVVEPFAMTENRPRTALVSEEFKQVVKIDPVQYAKKLSTRQPKIKAASTLKYDNQVEKRRREIEVQKKKDEDKLRVEKSLFQEDLRIKLLRKKELEQLDRKVEDRTTQKKEQTAKKQKDFGEWKANIIEKAKAQPLLYERALKKDEQMQKMKKLHGMHKIVEENVRGLKDKEQRDVLSNMFTKDELNLIKDYEYLLKSKNGLAS